MINFTYTTHSKKANIAFIIFSLKGELSMKTNKVVQLAKIAGQKLDKNSPAILTGLGVIGVATTAVMAVKATPKALLLLDEEYEVRRHFNPPFTRVEKFKLTWKVYVPSALMGVATMTAIITANRISLKRNIALAGLYSITEQTLEKYQEKVIETIGEKKEEEIRDEIAQDRLIASPIENHTVIETGNGNTLVYDTLSGRYFKSNMESIRSAMNDANYNMMTNMWMMLNEWYHSIGLPGIKIGKDIGWDVDHMIELDFSSKLTTGGEPCLVLDYQVIPSAALLR